jgi:polyribonucleotide nucleotidyltransferase
MFEETYASVTTNVAGREIKLETGKIARQATASIIASSGDNQVLVTVVAGREPEGQSFFPLTVNYTEKYYAAGKIPGSFFRREGRPTEKETLVSRLIDRPLRPLFPKGYFQEVQVICTVLSADKNESPEIISLIGASAAFAISGLPFEGPISAARVGFVDGSYVLNPDNESLEKSKLDMVVAGTKDAILMVESEAKELSEDQMLGAVLFAHQEMQKTITLIEELASKTSIPEIEYSIKEDNSELKEKIINIVRDDLVSAYSIPEKSKRQESVSLARDKMKESLSDEDLEDENAVSGYFKSVESEIVRSRLLNGDSRIDGRDLDTVRPIDIEVGFLNKSHGSCLFTRGETQSIGVATLGGSRDAQLIDALEGTTNDPFMLHYNFPPFSVGEAGFIGAPKRREIGHGKLARRALEAVLPSQEEFPYTIRVVSEITESNGSSSMATVCSSSLSMMDAGIPIKKAVAGVAMGLVLDGDDFCVITDILGDEDHLGDMDFKVAGTSDGVTALQMDIKVKGISEEIMEVALEKAQTARTHILEKMDSVLDSPRKELSPNAPQAVNMTIAKDKIREVIGKGGSVIKSITEKSGANVDINDDGEIKIFGDSPESRQTAIDLINQIVADPEVGQIYTGTVVKIVEFGAFVSIDGGKEGLVHVSEIMEERVEKVSDYLVEGEEVDVKVIGIDDRGRVKLSIKAVNSPEETIEG